MGNLLNTKYKITPQDIDTEELEIINRYNNELYLMRFTKEQVKDKINKYITIHSSPNRKFTRLQQYLEELNLKN